MIREYNFAHAGDKAKLTIHYIKHNLFDQQRGRESLALIYGINKPHKATK
jgi:hypothetical protein